MVRRKLLFDVCEDYGGGANRCVDAEKFEDRFVLWIVDTGNSPRNLEPALGDLTGNEVVLIFAGYSDQHVSPSYAGLVLGRSLAAVSPQHDVVAEFVGNLFGAMWLLLVTLNDENFVSLVEQPFCEVKPDLAAGLWR
jgi:hypothetical protein